MALNPLYGEIPEDPDLVLLADKILDRIHSKAVPILQVELGKKGLVLSERLLNGLSRSTNLMYQEKVVEKVLEMHQYGQFVDYKKLRYTNEPPVDDFIKYGLIGLNKGKFQMQFKSGHTPANKEAAVKKMAWAAVKRIGREATVTRPANRGSGWLKKYFEEVIFKMNDELLLLAEAVAMHESEYIIKKMLTDKK